MEKYIFFRLYMCETGGINNGEMEKKKGSTHVNFPFFDVLSALSVLGGDPICHP